MLRMCSTVIIRIIRNCQSNTYYCISRVPDRNGVSQAWYIVEMHHSGWKPWILFCLLFCDDLDSLPPSWLCPFLSLVPSILTRLSVTASSSVTLTFSFPVGASPGPGGRRCLWAWKECLLGMSPTEVAPNEVNLVHRSALAELYPGADPPVRIS